MNREREIWACANELIRQHGGGARRFAAQRADALCTAGDRDGHRTFTRIVARIEQLEATTPSGQLH